MVKNPSDFICADMFISTYLFNTLMLNLLIDRNFVSFRMSPVGVNTLSASLLKIAGIDSNKTGGEEFSSTHLYQMQINL